MPLQFLYKGIKCAKITIVCQNQVYNTIVLSFKLSFWLVNFLHAGHSLWFQVMVTHSVILFVVNCILLIVLHAICLKMFNKFEGISVELGAKGNQSVSLKV
jgi:hypothetical protein